MNLKTRHERPPIPTRAFDWLAYDADQDVCNDPECSCRTHVVQGWAATEHDAIVEWVRELLDRTDAPMPIDELVGWNRILAERLQRLECLIKNAIPPK